MLSTLMSMWGVTWRDPALVPPYTIIDGNGKVLSLGDTVTVTGKIASFTYIDHYNAAISVQSDNPSNAQGTIQIISLCVIKQ